VNLRRLQSGYMLEVPLIMVAVGIVLAIAVPKLSVVPAKVLVVIGTLIWIGGLYYMIVIPGWRPNNTSHSPRWWRLAKFFAIAALLCFVVGSYLMATN
jgi:hypothetical protein